MEGQEEETLWKHDGADKTEHLKPGKTDLVPGAKATKVDDDSEGQTAKDSRQWRQNSACPAG